MLENLFILAALVLTYLGFRKQISEDNKGRYIFIVLCVLAAAISISLWLDFNLSYLFDLSYKVFGNWTKMVIGK